MNTLIAVITHDGYVYVGAELAADPHGVIVLGSWELRQAPTVATARIKTIRVLTLALNSEDHPATVAEFAEAQGLKVGTLGGFHRPDLARQVEHQDEDEALTPDEAAFFRYVASAMRKLSGERDRTNERTRAMTPEERKALAQRHYREHSEPLGVGIYPECCSYHEGFDDALALLELRDYEHSVDDPSGEGTPLYAVKSG